MRNNKLDNKMQPLKNIWQSRNIVFWLAIIMAMIFFVISALIPPSYKSLSTIAVNQSRTVGLDAYREAKSSEFIARSIKEMVMANSFMQTVINDDNIHWEKISKEKSQDKKIKLWKKKIKVTIVPNTGIVHILVYTNNRELSKAINAKIINTLKDKELIFFSKKGINLNVIDEPYYFYKPAFPNLILNTLLGFIFGGMLAIILILLNNDEKSKTSSPIINLGINKKQKYTKIKDDDLN